MGPWRQTGSSLVRRALSGEEVDVFTESGEEVDMFISKKKFDYIKMTCSELPENVYLLSVIVSDHGKPLRRFYCINHSSDRLICYLYRDYK